MSKTTEIVEEPNILIQALSEAEGRLIAFLVILAIGSVLLFYDKITFEQLLILLGIAPPIDIAWTWIRKKLF